MNESAGARRWNMMLAFAAVYIIWGSTYLAIRYAIETLPGFTMAGFRFGISGLLLYAWGRARGGPKPSLRQWRVAAIVGVLLFLGGNGLVVWAEHWITSGLAALLVGTEPLWVAVLMLLWPGRDARPTGKTFGALITGFFGAALLAAPGADGSSLPLWPVVALMVAPLSWAAGSLILRGADLPGSMRVTTGMQMMTGGAALLLCGGGVGEWQGFRVAEVSATSWWAFAYLVLAGSIVAFSAFSYLARTTSPPLVATYAFVNPVVAVFLGWLIADEPVGPRTLVAATLIVGAVVWLMLEGRGRKTGDEANLVHATGTASETTDGAHPTEAGLRLGHRS